MAGNPVARHSNVKTRVVPRLRSDTRTSDSLVYHHDPLRLSILWIETRLSTFGARNMKYEALYSAVLSAAPAVLIGYVLEQRLAMKRDKFRLKGGYRRFVSITINLTGLSGVLAMMALGGLKGGDSWPYAAAVGTMLGLGIGGLTALLDLSVTGSGLGKDSGAP